MHSHNERRRRRARSLRLLAGGLSLVFLSVVDEQVVPQTRLDQDNSSGRPSFRVATETVLLSVSVLDDKGMPVAGLERHNFSVYEDGVPQEITYFEHNASSDTVSTGIVLLIDTSSSMRGAELLEARNAALRFLEEAPTHAEIALIGFGHDLSVIHDFTTDRRSLVQAVQRLEAGGGTALHDGLIHGIELLDGSNSQRQLLMILSDGKDLDSSSRFADVTRRLESSSVVVYSVGLYSPRDRELFVGVGQYYKAPAVEVNLNPAWVLIEVARISGGAAHFPKEAPALEPLFTEIARGMRLQYLLAYSPPPPDGESRFRTIRVRARPSEAVAMPLTVRARRGYVR